LQRYTSPSRRNRGVRAFLLHGKDPLKSRPLWDGTGVFRLSSNHKPITSRRHSRTGGASTSERNGDYALVFVSLPLVKKILTANDRAIGPLLSIGGQSVRQGGSVVAPSFCGTRSAVLWLDARPCQLGQDPIHSTRSCITWKQDRRSCAIGLCPVRRYADDGFAEETSCLLRKRFRVRIPHTGKFQNGEFVFPGCAARQKHRTCFGPNILPSCREPYPRLRRGILHYKPFLTEPPPTPPPGDPFSTGDGRSPHRFVTARQRALVDKIARFCEKPPFAGAHMPILSFLIDRFEHQPAIS